ncbi:AAA family ATPase [Methylomonas paludis]|uniref:AAA family ATPase n=1 Tax=Methylomonas paludis TaxID=1173101 RepID=A0A975R918_9GAMM|nr:ATP-binding protein [Methylomonas paludis]QWF69813.1 AAA family ATPase [Methylomonas paludis]
MKLKKIYINNFRRLAEIEFELSKNIAVVVGPNAVGKSSIFEAIRLAKAILFPRMQDELRNVLINLGATSAHFFQNTFQFDISALAGDPNQSLKISLFISFSAEEIEMLRQAKPQIARSLTTILLGRTPDDPQFDLRAYFSTSQGKEALQSATNEVDRAWEQLNPDKAIEMSVDISAQQMNSSSAVNNLFAGFLEQRLQPDRAILSYFPADRSMPQGEIAIQVGAQDFKAQADSHLAHATSKYGRLKQTVVNQAVLAGIEHRDLKKDFDSIFETLLPGKEFVGLRQKQTGLVSVLIRDTKSDRVFDIDSLSSGEKGLILSFLLYRTASVPGSIILVDEPELHLNPAVCKKILPYLVDYIIRETDCQFLISTHSVEILKDAYENHNSELFHLRNDRDISPVLLQDTDEMREAMSRLGVSAEQALTSKGTIFVEGDTDVAILEVGFQKILSGILVKPLNGRTEIEKSIRDLQAAEKKGGVKERHAFLFDHDSKPSGLPSTALVKVEQLQKYCIENYLIDETCLFNLINMHGKTPPESRGAFARELKQLALDQLDEVVQQKHLNPFRSLRVGLLKKDINRKTNIEIAELQYNQLNETLSEIKNILNQENWEENFVERCNTTRTELEPIWENDWKKLCSGKRLFDDLQRKYQINFDLVRFKKTLIQELVKHETDDITALQGILDRLLA